VTEEWPLQQIGVTVRDDAHDRTLAYDSARRQPGPVAECLT
jgi:hypothetical protein